MKVPTYQAKGAITKEVGAIQMSVQANAGALSQGISAFGDLGGQVAKEGFTWYQQELKSQRASELASKTNELTKFLQNQQVIAKTTAASDPIKALADYNTKTKGYVSDLSKGIKDPIVKKRFLSSSTTDISNKRSAILQTARNAQIDIGKANIITRASQLENIIATGTPSEQIKAKNELFGIEVFPGKFAGGLYSEAASSGFFTNVDATNRSLTSKGNVARIKVRSEVNVAAISGKSNDALMVLNKLLNPKEFPNLRPEDRTNLIRETNSLVGTLERRAISLDTRNAKKAKKIQTAKQDANFVDVLTRFLKSSEPGSTVATPTANEVLTLFSDLDIDDKQFKILNEAIRGQDAPISDASVVAGFYERLALAQNNDEIQEVIGDVMKVIGPSGSVVLTDAIGIIKTAKGYTSGSAETKGLARYATILKTAIGDTPGGFTVSGIKAQTTSGMRKADAMATYYALVGEGGDPKEVYKEIAGMYASNLDKEFGFIAPTSRLLKEVGKENIKNWTMDDIDNAKAFLKANPRSTRDNKPTFTPLEVVLEKETLSFIEGMVKEKLAAAAALSITNNDNEQQSGGVGWGDWTKSLFKNDDIRNPQ